VEEDLLEVDLDLLREIEEQETQKIRDVKEVEKEAEREAEREVEKEVEVLVPLKLKRV